MSLQKKCKSNTYTEVYPTIKINLTKITAAGD